MPERLIDANKLLKMRFSHGFNDEGELLVPFREVMKAIRLAPTVDAVRVRQRNPDDENCVICNSELDEKYAGGIWDLAGEICDIICPECDHDEQDTAYNIIRNYIEAQNYCPKCGAKMDGKGEDNA